MDFSELLSHLFSPVNAVLTILLILSILYWVITIIGGFDVDLGLDGDIDLDADIDVDINGSPHVEGGIDIPDEAPSDFIHFLKFLNLDVIPITFFLTLTLLFTWFMSLNINYYLSLPTWLGLICIIPLFSISLFITKFLTIPLRGIFKHINHKGEEAYNFIGQAGKMITAIEGDKLSMMEVLMNNDPIRLMVKSNDGSKISAGDKVEIVGEADDKKYYYVVKSNENN